MSSRAVSTLFVPAAMTLADCTVSQARRFGLTAEIHASVDRALTQDRAAALARAGYQGIRFFVRHDPAQQRIAANRRSGTASRD